ncbi:hypothetical protein PG994_005328 [Apiospora phragmitis]|uniref:Uncharacterized protein n=1 Tax=Apiospora phragmitis TaxID=2905665 RepID=A0ABR1VBY8_9PEZI
MLNGAIHRFATDSVMSGLGSCDRRRDSDREGGEDDHPEVPIEVRVLDRVPRARATIATVASGSLVITLADQLSRPTRVLPRWDLAPRIPHHPTPPWPPLPRERRVDNKSHYIPAPSIPTYDEAVHSSASNNDWQLPPRSPADFRPDAETEARIFSPLPHDCAQTFSSLLLLCLNGVWLLSSLRNGFSIS